MKCRLCDHEAAVELCRHHERAKVRIEMAYVQWARAYGTLNWKTYLDRVITNDQTGQWAKEVAELLKSDIDDKRDN
jgi:hypothetical protein